MSDRDRDWLIVGGFAWLVGGVVLALSSTSCNEHQAAVEELARVKAESAKVSASIEPLNAEVWRLVSARDALQKQNAALAEDVRVREAEQSGRGVHYVLSVSIRQVSYSFSLRKQLRDMVNEERFDLPTDRVTYEHTSVGQDLFDSFRAGSAIFHGSLGSWRLKVEGKRIVTD